MPIDLDPKSIPQQLAYYELYGDVEALKRACELLGTDLRQLPTLDLNCIVNLLAKQGREEEPLPLEQLEVLKELGSPLLHRSLAGHACTTEAQVLALPENEIDLSRALLLSQFEGQMEKILTYEALLDLMALQVLARTSFNSSPEEKIRAINQLLFYEMHLRFPPHSLWTDEVDLYTFLPAVLDSRRGVCLGVSALYLSLAQRIGLELEAVTPPGHIYLRTPDEKINIETTARGIHIPSKQYLSLHTKALQRRSIREITGLTFVNQASSLWQAGEIKAAIAAYEHALLYQPNDPLTKEFLGYTCLIDGQIERGRALLQEIAGYCPEYALSPGTLPIDLLANKVGTEGIEAIFLHVDEKRDSILKKQSTLRTILKEYPAFRSGWLQLATTYLQLGRGGEAIDALNHYHALDASDPVVEYYLATLCLERHHYPAAWQHLEQAEKLTTEAGYAAEPLKQLRRQLRSLSPR
ncbi:MAG: hypothetical protein JSR80_02895 [Verrucomicrobia bacterium]|nr:hypothetical protein [Verrucomicrobiota bacterium]